MPRKQNTSNKKPRASSSTVELRVLAILHIKLMGAGPWDILHYVSAQEKSGVVPWRLEPSQKPLCNRTIRRYVAAANERISEACRTHEPEAFFLLVSKVRYVYAIAVKAGKIRAALAALELEARLMDLYPAPKKAVEPDVVRARLVIHEIIIEPDLTPDEDPVKTPAAML